MNLSIEADDNIEKAGLLQIQELLEKAIKEEPAKSSFNFIQEFEDEVNAYIFQNLHELMQIISIKYLGADEIDFKKSIEITVTSDTILKASFFRDFVGKVKPYFKKLKGFFGNKEKKTIDVKEDIVYNPESKDPMSNKEFDKIKDTVADFLGDRISGTDEELAVKTGVMSLLARKMEKEGVPKKKIEKMSYKELEEKNGKLPKTIEEAEKKYDLSDAQVRAIKYAKERAADQLSISDGAIKNSIVQSVRKQVVQGLEEGLSSNELAQRLFYTDTFDKVPPELNNATIDAINRDWRRVARTEIASAMNNGYLQGLVEDADPGQPIYAYFDGDWSTDDKPGSPTDCNKWLGTVVRVFDSPRDSGRITGDPYAKYAVWPGKKNSDRGATPSIPMHPHCRHRWSTFNPDSHEVLIFNQKGKKLDRKQLIKKQNPEFDVHIQVTSKKSSQ